MIKLGKKVKDIVTGFEGIAVSRVEYLNGCVQYGIKPKAKKGCIVLEDATYIDAQQLEVIGKGVTVETRSTGADFMPDAPTH